VSSGSTVAMTVCQPAGSTTTTSTTSTTTTIGPGPGL
jgi:hypothetical protein